MARKARLEYPGAVYHVINRGNYRSWIFGDDGAKAGFEKALRETCERAGWRLFAYVVMGNHFHLAVETPEPNLSEGMRYLQSVFAMRFNKLRKENGRLFQGRFKSIVVEGGDRLGWLCDYIHLNPARAKICEVSALGSYRFGSYPLLFSPKARPSYLDPRPCLVNRQMPPFVSLVKLGVASLTQNATGFDLLSILGVGELLPNNQLKINLPEVLGVPSSVANQIDWGDLRGPGNNTPWLLDLDGDGTDETTLDPLNVSGKTSVKILGQMVDITVDQNGVQVGLGKFKVRRNNNGELVVDLPGQLLGLGDHELELSFSPLDASFPMLFVNKLNSSGNETGDLVAVDFANVGRMEGGVVNSYYNTISMDEDIDRFYIKIKNVDSYEDVSVMLGTKKADSSVEDSPHLVNLSLESSGEWFVSDPQLLVADEVDDLHADYAGPDEDDDDQTHRVQLGGKVWVTSVFVDGSEIVTDQSWDVPVLKELDVNVVVLKDHNGNPCESESEVHEDMRLTDERFAQAGIKINWSYSVKDSLSGIDLQNGLQLINSSDGSLADETKTIIEKLGTKPDVSDIHVFYINYLTGFDSNVAGVALYPYYVDSVGDSEYANNAFVKPSDTYTLAHEIGHLLTNEMMSDSLYDSVMTDDGHWDGSEEHLNLMRPMLVNLSEVRGSKRLRDIQTGVMLEHSHCKDPEH